MFTWYNNGMNILQKAGVKMDKKRDKRGRWVKRVPGEYSKHVYAMRLTDNEYQLVKRARADGLSPRKAMIEMLRKRLGEADE